MGKFSLFVSVLCLIFLPAIVFAVGDNVQRISKEELKAKMEKGEGVIVLDVRASGSYDGSAVKIKGALRIAPDEIEARYKELPKDKEIIAYCT